MKKEFHNLKALSYDEMRQVKGGHIQSPIADAGCGPTNGCSDGSKCVDKDGYCSMCCVAG